MNRFIFFYSSLFQRCFKKGNASLAAVCTQKARRIQSDITVSEPALMLRILLVSGSFLSAVACTTSNQITLSDAQRSELATIQVYPLIVQDEVYPNLDRQNVMGASGQGLLPAVVEANIDGQANREAHRELMLLYKEIGSLDARQMMASAFENTLSEQWTVRGIGRRAEAVILEKRDIVDRISSLESSEHFLYSGLSYRFFEDYRFLVVAMEVELYDSRSADNKDNNVFNKPDPIYQSRFVYQSDLIDQAGEAAIAHWAKHDAKQFVQTLASGINEVTRMMVWDLAGKFSEEPCYRAVMGPKGDSPANAIKGWLMQGDHTGRHVMQDHDGTYYSKKGRVVYRADGHRGECSDKPDV